MKKSQFEGSIVIKSVSVRRQEPVGNHSKRTRLYFSKHTEPGIKSALSDLLLDRYTQDSRFYRTHVLPLLHGVQPTSPHAFLFIMDHAWSWSQYAGCKCPCSPGFISKNSYGYDIYVTYEMVPASQPESVKN